MWIKHKMPGLNCKRKSSTKALFSYSLARHTKSTQHLHLQCVPDGLRSELCLTLFTDKAEWQCLYKWGYIFSRLFCSSFLGTHLYLYIGSKSRWCTWPLYIIPFPPLFPTTAGGERGASAAAGPWLTAQSLLCAAPCSGKFSVSVAKRAALGCSWCCP